MFDHLHGQFAVALWDAPAAALDPGPRPLRHLSALLDRSSGDWLLFGSEIKALLASGMVPSAPTCAASTTSSPSSPCPARSPASRAFQLAARPFPRCRLGSGTERVSRDRIYWEIDFPDSGQEEDGTAKALTDRFEEVMLGAVEQRLRADVPVVSYLSGGVDSSIVVAMASKVRGQPIPTFTIRIEDPKLDETSEAGIVARHVGSKPSVVECRRGRGAEHLPRA